MWRKATQMTIKVDLNGKMITVNNQQTMLNSVMEAEVHFTKLLQRGYRFEKQDNVGRVYTYVGPETPTHNNMTHHERIFDLVDQFKSGAIACIHKLESEGQLDMLTYVSSHVTMYDLHIALYGRFDWENRWVGVRHCSSHNKTRFMYTPNDTLRSIACKAHDIAVERHSAECYSSRGVSESSIMEVICSVMDRDHLIEGRQF
jgi:hypothetical protein